MLRAVFRLLFGAPPFREPFHDPALGVLIGCETGWSINVKKGMDSFTFTIGGESQPSAALLSHAREIFNDYGTFKTAVKRCIENESRDYPADAKAEVAKLEIDRICLFWPDRPDDGMIFFRGSENDIGLWRCDYIARKPTGLGCDT